MIGVETLEYGNQLIPLLTDIGYLYRGDDGIPNRHYFKKRRNGVTTHHLHMSPIGSQVWNNQILFRDYMRKYPEKLQEYIKLKYLLAIKYLEDRESYSHDKQDFILSVLEEAHDLKRVRKL